MTTKTKTKKWKREQAAANLRAAAELPMDVKLSAIASVIQRCGDDEEIALTALTMEPRPAWVAEALGLHPDRSVGA